MDIQEELLNVINLLNVVKIEYALCGGLALAVYGYPRATKDIDIIIKTDDLERTLFYLEPMGYILPGGLIPFNPGTPEAQNVYRISKAEDDDFLTIDLILVSPALTNAWQNREVVEWRGLQIQVVSPEGLIEMKRRAGRKQDLADIEKLEALVEPNEKESNP